MERSTLTSRSESVTSSFRFSRYDPAWRDTKGTWPAEVWTEVFDVARNAQPIPVEYQVVEDLLCSAAIMCLGADLGRLTAARGMEANRLIEAKLRSLGAAIDIPQASSHPFIESDVVKLLRASLRGQVWCEFEGSHARCAVGHEMYVHIEADSVSRAQELAATVEVMGLFTQWTKYPWEMHD